MRALVLAMLIICGLMTTGCGGGMSTSAEDQQGLARPGRDVESPSGKYRLRVIEEDNGELTFEVLGEAVERYRADVSYSDRFTTYFLWDDTADKVWVYSGDVGTYIWELKESGWSSRPWRGSGLMAPTFLQEEVPRRFREPG